VSRRRECETSPMSSTIKSSKNPVLAIAAPVRCEARYILEWIAYHRVLGVKVFFLADNGGSDQTSTLLQDLSATGLILRFDWRKQ
jgi:Glycosyl transferase family 2